MGYTWSVSRCFVPSGRGGGKLDHLSSLAYGPLTDLLPRIIKTPTHPRRPALPERFLAWRESKGKSSRAPLAPMPIAPPEADSNP